MQSTEDDLLCVFIWKVAWAQRVTARDWAISLRAAHLGFFH
jgi:hypothetical protein